MKIVMSNGKVAKLRHFDRLHSINAQLYINKYMTILTNKVVFYDRSFVGLYCVLTLRQISAVV